MTVITENISQKVKSIFSIKYYRNIIITTKHTSMFNRIILGYIIKHYCSIGYRRGDRINPIEEWILDTCKGPSEAKRNGLYIILSCSSYYYYYYYYYVYTSRVLQTRVWVWQMDVRQWSIQSDSVDFIARITLSHELPWWCNVNYILHYGEIHTYTHRFLTYNHIIYNIFIVHCKGIFPVHSVERDRSPIKQ